MTTSAFSEARVRTAQAQASSGKLSERHSTRVPVASKPRDCAPSTIRLCRKATVYRFEARLDLEARKAYVAGTGLACSKQQVFGPAGSSSELRAPEERSPRRLPRGWSSRVPISIGTIPGNYSRSPVIHTTVRPRASGWSFGTTLVLRSPGSDRPPNLRIRWTPTA